MNTNNNNNNSLQQWLHSHGNPGMYTSVQKGTLCSGGNQGFASTASSPYSQQQQYQSNLYSNQSPYSESSQKLSSTAEHSYNPYGNQYSSSGSYGQQQHSLHHINVNQQHQSTSPMPHIQQQQQQQFGGVRGAIRHPISPYAQNTQLSQPPLISSIKVQQNTPIFSSSPYSSTNISSQSQQQQYPSTYNISQTSNTSGGKSTNAFHHGDKKRTKGLTGSGAKREEKRKRRGTRRESPAKRSLSPKPERDETRRKEASRREQETYLFRISAPLFDTFERCYVDVRRRYPNLHISADFTKLISHWTKTVSIDGREVRITNPVKIICDNETGLLDKTTSPSEPASLYKGIKYNAKVMICLGTDHIGSEDQHLSSRLRFLVGKKDRSGLMCIGGSWCSKDGGDPINDDNVLIRTATRCTKDYIGLDLEKCTEWIKFLEICYFRPEETYQGKKYPEMEEKTVIFIPNIHSILPSVKEFEKIWKERQEQKVDMSLEKKETQEEEGEEASQKSTEKESIPSEPAIYAVTQKDKLNNNIKCMTISLDGIMDYNLDDRLEKTFEVSLFGEAYHEMLQRKFGMMIFETLKKCQGVSNSEKLSERENAKSQSPLTKKQKLMHTDNDHPATCNEKEEGKTFMTSPETTATSSVDNEGPDPNILASFRYFDRNRVGYIRAGDVESIIHSLGLGLSKGYVHGLVSSLSDDFASRIYYADLCMRVASVEKRVTNSTASSEVSEKMSASADVTDGSDSAVSDSSTGSCRKHSKDEEQESSVNSEHSSGTSKAPSSLDVSSTGVVSENHSTSDTTECVENQQDSEI